MNGALLAGASVVAGSLEQVCKILERSRNDKETVQRMLEGKNCNEFDDLIEASQFLSCIVAGVYKRCICSQQEQDSYYKNVDQHWKHWGYKIVDFENLGQAYEKVDKDRSLVGDLGQPKDQCVRVVLFERSDNQATRDVLMRVEGPPDQLTPVRLPKYLLAIRGTIVPRYDDIMGDLKIAGEVLHISEGLYEPVKRLVRAIILKYRGNDVWVAGHSLGAALALVATRSLAIEESIVINPHLFNPPYLTAARLASKAMRGVLNGAGDAGNRVLHGFGMENAWNIRAGTDKVANTCRTLLRKLSSKGRRIAKSSYAKKMEDEAQKLIQIRYVPNLYVNPKDAICNEYITHFQRHPNVNTSVVSEAIQWFVPAKSVHMISSAVVYINHWGEGPLEAHKLLQWFRYPHINLTVERQGRTADGISRTPSKFIGKYQS